MAAKPVPDGYHTVTPYLIVPGAAQLIDFLKQVFDAEEIVRMARSDGRIMHAEVRIGDSMIMLGDAAEEAHARLGMIHLYVPDADAAYRRALASGATSLQEPKDQFYGDRSGAVADPLGNHWWIATHVEDVAPEELARRAEAALQA
jgi:PhnB protein